MGVGSTGCSLGGVESHFQEGEPLVLLVEVGSDPLCGGLLRKRE